MAQDIKDDDGLARIIFELQKMSGDMRDLADSLKRHDKKTKRRVYKMSDKEGPDQPLTMYEWSKTA